MRYAYPIMLDVTGRLVVIVGGGAVAARKARGLLEAGAGRIRCVAPAFDPQMPEAVERICQPYRPNHLAGAALVFAATDVPTVNDAVVRDSHARGLFVNRADSDDEQPGDFSTPARMQKSAVTVAVSTSSPALAVFIRDVLAQKWDARWTALADAMQALRPRIKATEGLDASHRAAIFREMASEEAMELASRGGAEALAAWLAERHPELKHG